MRLFCRCFALQSKTVPMKTDLQTLLQIAHLARLELDKASEEKMLHDLNRILDWVEQLNEVDTTGVEPLTHMSEEVNVMREDEPQQPLPHDKALLNAPKKDSDYFRVPKVLD
jgi:aspartyl-tRNA(Asn)/glutamyl-tRNA(Gln) amidotransferase subunit C